MGFVFGKLEIWFHCGPYVLWNRVVLLRQQRIKVSGEKEKNSLSWKCEEKRFVLETEGCLGFKAVMSRNRS